MDKITIHDCCQQIKTVCDDLRAIYSVSLTVGDHPEYANANEALTVIHRALTPIISDLEETVGILQTEFSVQEQR